MRRKPDYEESSGNVFADLGFRNSKQELLKAKLTVEIYRLVDARFAPWSRAEGSQPIDSALLPALSLVPHDLVSFG